jgi:hypothetical protein
MRDLQDEGHDGGFEPRARRLGTARQRFVTALLVTGLVFGGSGAVVLAAKGGGGGGGGGGNGGHQQYCPNDGPHIPGLGCGPK